MAEAGERGDAQVPREPVAHHDVVRERRGAEGHERGAPDERDGDENGEARPAAEPPKSPRPALAPEPDRRRQDGQEAGRALGEAGHGDRDPEGDQPATSIRGFRRSPERPRGERGERDHQHARQHLETVLAAPVRGDTIKPAARPARRPKSDAPSRNVANTVATAATATGRLAAVSVSPPPARATATMVHG